MKKYLALILVICLTLSFCACSKDKNESNDTASVADYSHITPDSLEILKYESAMKHGIDLTQLSKKDTSVTVPKSKNFNWNGKVLELSYHSSRIYSDSIAESNYNRRFDEYTFTDPETQESYLVQYLNGTDEIVDLLISYRDCYNGDEKLLNEDEIKETTDNFLASVLSEDDFEKYQPINVSFPNKGLRFTYTVIYERKVNGFKTGETVAVRINRKKEVVGYSFIHLGLFDNIEKAYSQELLEATANAFKQKLLNDGYDEGSILGPVLVTDVAGNVYIKYEIHYYAPDYMILPIYAKVEQ